MIKGKQIFKNLRRLVRPVSFYLFWLIVDNCLCVNLNRFLAILLCIRCYSYVGRQSRGQGISLQRNGCLFQSTVQHEVLHALGFHHEQVRSDRDQYVKILTENIIPGQLNYTNLWLHFTLVQDSRHSVLYQ